MKNKTLHFAKVAVTSIAFFGFVAFAAASTWTAPTGTAPASDVAAPVNISSTAQTKAGELDVTNFYNWGTEFISGLTAIGAVWPGTTSTTPPLYVGATSGTSAVFGGGVGIRGSLGVTNSGGTVVSTTTPGFDTIYVQGIAVCLQNGVDCPSSSGSSGLSSVSHDTTLTGSGTSASPLSINIIHDSTLTGAGTAASPLSVVSSGGTGGLSSVSHDGTLSGSGTSGSPLSVTQGAALYKINPSCLEELEFTNTSFGIAVNASWTMTNMLTTSSTCTDFAEGTFSNTLVGYLP